MGIPDTARAVNSARLYGVASAAYSAIGWGTSTTVFSAAQTALVTGVTLAGAGDAGVHAIPGASVTSSSVTTTVTNDTAQWVGTATASSGFTIAEAGLFNADTNGVMGMRQTFTGIPLVSGDSIAFTIKIKNA